MAAKLEATLLPATVPTTLYVVHGRLTFEPHPNARELAPSGGYVLPGLVDVHTHADFPQAALPPGGRAEFVRTNLRDFAGVGTLLLRDLGASARTLDELERQEGEPRVVAAGECLIGCKNHCFPITAPERMVEAAARQVRPGVEWVKIFTDWPDPRVEVDGKNTYFTDENPLTYEPTRLREMVAAVHAAGGRVASHCFTRRGARVSVDAGVDSLEHGWGVTEDLLAEMVAREIAWVPLVGLARPMMSLADADGRPDQRRWIEECLERMRSTLPAAVEAGVTLATGTDWFPVVTIAHEVCALVELGVPVDAALVAASDGGRRLLRRPGLEEGAPADLVLYATDPRRDPSVLTRPNLILIGGEQVTPRVPVLPRRQRRDASETRRH